MRLMSMDVVHDSDLGHLIGRYVDRDDSAGSVNERKKNKFDQAYNKLKQLVIDYRFKPGEQLIVRILSDNLGVGLTPIREALIRLSNEKLVLPSRSGGFQMRNLDAYEMSNLYQFAFLIMKDSCRHIISASENNLRKLLDIDLKGCEGDVQRLAITIEQIYSTIVRLSANEDMIEMIRRFNDRSHFVRTTGIQFKGNQQLVAEIASDLLAAIKAKSVDGAVDRLQALLDMKLEAMPDVIKECFVRSSKASVYAEA